MTDIVRGTGILNLRGFLLSERGSVDHVDSEWRHARNYKRSNGETVDIDTTVDSGVVDTAGPPSLVAGMHIKPTKAST